MWFNYSSDTSEENFLCPSNRLIAIPFLQTQVVYRIGAHRLTHRINRVRQARREVSRHHGLLAVGRAVQYPLLRSICTLWDARCSLNTQSAPSVLLGRRQFTSAVDVSERNLTASESHSEWGLHWSVSQSSFHVHYKDGGQPIYLTL